MAFNPDEFKARIEGNLAAPAYFRVLLSGAIVDSDGSKLLSLLCNQAQLPGRNFATNEYTTHGPIRKQPYSTIYDDIVLSFYCKEDMGVKTLFQEWQSFIQDNSASNEFSYFDDYVTDMIVEQFDASGKSIYSVRLIDAYPVMVAPLDLNWASQNSFHNLQVTMAFRYWREEPLNINPFGNYLQVNSIFPNFDISGALEKTGVAIFSRADGELMSRGSQTISFGRDINSRSHKNVGFKKTLTKTKSTLSGTQQGDNTFVNQNGS